METDITLRKGLENFRVKYKDVLSHTQEDNSEEARSFFESHDIAHVLFECDISLYGEGSLKIWTIFGTTLGFWNHIKGYQDANALELSKDYTMHDVVKDLFRFLLTIPKIIYRASRMSKPWKWDGYEQYLDRPLSEIREEFNIKLL